MGAGLTYYTGPGTLHLAAAFWSAQFWSHVASGFHGILSGILSIFAFVLYLTIVLAALFVTTMAIGLTLFCLKRFIVGLAGGEVEREV